jgi:hypothetical protein
VATLTHPRRRPPAGKQTTRRGAHLGGLWGLASRGLLYLVLAFLALELVSGRSNKNVDARGALHQLAHDTAGQITLGVLAVGFVGFALWHALVAWRPTGAGSDTGERLANAARAVVYGLLAALTISFLTTSAQQGNTDQTDQTWTARILEWPAGRWIVGATGIAIIGAGLYLLWRAFSDDRQDERAVLHAAPRETRSLRALGRIGNVARGGVVALIGVFVLQAAIEHDPSQTVGLDGALKRLLDESYGDVLVVLVAIGFASFGIYSIARAWVNRGQPTRTS